MSGQQCDPVDSLTRSIYDHRCGLARHDDNAILENAILTFSLVVRLQLDIKKNYRKVQNNTWIVNGSGPTALGH